MIYFDNAATTPVLPCAWNAMHVAPNGNPSSIHAVGRVAKAALERSRAIIAQCINCLPSEVYFTSGATESCNWMVKCLRIESNDIIYSDRLHHAVTESLQSLPSRFSPRKGFAAIESLVNNETGEIRDQATWVDFRNTLAGSGLFGIDATAAVGHLPVDFSALGADYMALGGHKFGAPKGIGALIVRQGCPITPLLHGGAQERGMRGGTVSVPLVSSMAAALTWRSLHMAENEKAIRAVAQELIISLGCHHVDFDINLPGGKSSKDCAHHILSIRFPGVYGAALAAALSENGVMVSTGSACSSGDNAASANLMASGLTEQQALETIRFSFDWYNTTKEAAHAAGIIADIVPTLRRG